MIWNEKQKLKITRNALKFELILSLLDFIGCFGTQIGMRCNKIEHRLELAMRYGKNIASASNADLTKKKMFCPRAKQIKSLNLSVDVQRNGKSDGRSVNEWLLIHACIYFAQSGIN